MSEPRGIEFVAPEASPEDLAREQECRRILKRSIARLPDRQALLVRLRYGAEFTLEEIARLFGVQRSAVHAMQLRAVAALREDLETSGISALRHLL